MDGLILINYSKFHRSNIHIITETIEKSMTLGAIIGHLMEAKENGTKKS